MNRRALAFGVVALLVVAFVALNMVATPLFRGVRIDATQGSVYTLTKGSRNIAKSPDEPIRLTFYYTPKLAQGQPQIQSHAQRVRELLQEYARVSGGKIKLDIADPEPFTEAEDRAVAEGLQGIPLAGGDTLYLGLVGVNSSDGKEVIPFFDPQQERLIEYDISRLIYSLAHPKKKVVGLITPLQMEGGFTFDPRTRQPTQTPSWRVIDEMKSFFDVHNLGVGVQVIPDDVDVLMVVHPRGLSDATLYAIDQFVMKGGHLLAFVDPDYEGDPSAPPGSPPTAKASDLNKILNAWGLEVPPDKVAADRDLALRPRFAGRKEPVPYVVWIDADEKSLSREDAITASLARVLLPTPGYITPLMKPKPDAPKKEEGKPEQPAAADGPALEPVTPSVNVEPLIRTTGKAMQMPVVMLGLELNPEQLLAGYAPGDHELTLAARLTGSAKSAFPDGAPKPPEGQQPPKDPKPHLAQSAAPINVVLVADVDMLMDQFWVRRENVFGMEMASKFRDNGAFAQAALDNLAGSDDLIAVRARRDTNRPFTVVEAMQRRADARFAAEKKLLEEKLKETQQNLQQLEAKRPDDPNASLVLTPEQKAAVDKFREEYAQTRRQLRTVQLNLRKDIENLGTQLKAINIGLVPILVTLAAMGVLLARGSRRRKAKAAAAQQPART